MSQTFIPEGKISTDLYISYLYRHACVYMQIDLVCNINERNMEENWISIEFNAHNSLLSYNSLMRYIVISIYRASELTIYGSHLNFYTLSDLWEILVR